MPTARFNLRNPSGTSPQPINLLVRFNNERLKYATGFSVLPKYWSDEKQRVKNVTHVADKDEINNHLKALEGEVTKFLAATDRGRATVEALRLRLDILTGKAKAPDRDFFGFVRAFVKEAPNTILPKTGKKISPRTVAKYKTTLEKLEEFAKQYRRKVDFETIDSTFYADFLAFLAAQNYSTNGTGKFIATLKKFLNAADSKGIALSPEFKKGKFPTPEEDADAIYLNETELAKLFALDLAHLTRLERVRDLFLVGCWTGLRFSDFSTLKADAIKGEFIHWEQFKGAKKVVIPIHPTVKAIFEKYGGNLPQTISNQNMNDYIKEVCQLAGMVEKEAKGITKGGVRIVQFFEKWQLVSSHSARRSFATNLYEAGFPSISIMKITGHRTEKAFLKYIKLSQEQHAKMLQMHWQQGGKKSALKVV
jgi:site-specific recombinase XerD